jgi:hypothetical protein
MLFPYLISISFTKAEPVNWFQFAIAQVVAVIVGAMIPILALYIKEKLDAKKRIAEWFEIKYIEECIDVLLQFLNGWFLMSYKPVQEVKDVLRSNKYNKMPTNAISRLETIVDGCDFSNWIINMQALRSRVLSNGDSHILDKFRSQTSNIVLRLNELRKNLLKNYDGIVLKWYN